MTARNKLNNRAQYWSGRAREAVGKLTGNRRAQREGKLDQVKANLKDHGERLRDAFRRNPRRAGHSGGWRASSSGALSEDDSFNHFRSRRS